MLLDRIKFHSAIWASKTDKLRNTQKLIESFISIIKYRYLKWTLTISYWNPTNKLWSSVYRCKFNSNWHSPHNIRSVAQNVPTRFALRSTRPMPLLIYANRMTRWTKKIVSRRIALILPEKSLCPSCLPRVNKSTMAYEMGTAVRSELEYFVTLAQRY